MHAHYCITASCRIWIVSRWTVYRTSQL